MKVGSRENMKVGRRENMKVGRRENMKVRIFKVFGLLMLCAVLSAGGSRAWAVTGNASLNNNYACAGTGVTTPAFLAFDESGVLNFANGTTVGSPAGGGWSFDVFGLNTEQVAVVPNPNYLCDEQGVCTITLTFAGGTPIAFPPGVTFTNNAVLSNIDSMGIAHTFVMTFQPPPTAVDLVSVAVCQAESQAVGNPIP